MCSVDSRWTSPKNNSAGIRSLLLCGVRGESKRQLRFVAANDDRQPYSRSICAGCFNATGIPHSMELLSFCSLGVPAMQLAPISQIECCG